MSHDRVRLLAVALAVGLAPGAGASVSADLSRCAAIAAPDTRLACYDQLAGRAADGRPIADVAAPAAAAAAASARAVALANPPQDFGLTKAQVKPAPATPAEVPELKALVAGVGSDRNGHTLVTLDNGQTWSFSDDDVRLAAGDPVTIRRAALGSFLMITPSRHTHHVHRTR